MTSIPQVPVPLEQPLEHLPSLPRPYTRLEEGYVVRDTPTLQEAAVEWGLGVGGSAPSPGLKSWLCHYVMKLQKGVCSQGKLFKQCISLKLNKYIPSIYPVEELLHMCSRKHRQDCSQTKYIIIHTNYRKIHQAWKSPLCPMTEEQID